MSLTWSFFDVADRIGKVLAAAETELRLEQAVYGLDAKDEKTIQGLLADRLTHDYEVAREVHYPSSVTSKRTHRQRCDLVLSPKGRPIQRDFLPATLFDPPDVCPPAEALWLEVKCAYQFREGGVRHSGYGQQWRSAVVDDLRKMEAEEPIRQAGLLLIVFNESPTVLEKDLDLFETILAQREVLAGFRQVRTIPILDRIGHTLCTAALWPTLQR
jgi:hypothetical protein